MSRKHLKKLGISLATAALLSVNTGFPAIVLAGSSNEEVEDQTEEIEIDKSEEVSNDAEELIVESVEVLANKVTFVNFNRELLEDEVKAEDFKIAANGESLEITSFYVNPTSIALGFPEIERTNETQTIVVEVEFNGKIIKSEPFEIKPKILKITDIIGAFEDIEVEFGGEYKLPEDVEVRLSNGKMISVPVRWKDTVNVNKSGTYELEGNLYVSDLENIATTSRIVKVNIIVAEEDEEDESTEEELEAVRQMIKDLPLPKNVTLEDKGAIEAAREAYNALTKEHQELVKNEPLLKLAEEKVAELEDPEEDGEDESTEEELEAVRQMIKDLPLPKNVTLEDKGAIEAAREAYNALTKEHQELVKNEPLLKLAEDKVAELEDPEEDGEDESTEEELEAVEKIKRAIYNLPKASELTLTDKDKIEEVRKMYNNLSDKDKEFVTSISQLEKREAKIAELEEEQVNALETIQGYIEDKDLRGLTIEILETAGVTDADKGNLWEYRLSLQGKLMNDDQFTIDDLEALQMIIDGVNKEVNAA